MDLSDCGKISGAGLDALVRQCGRLRVLNLERCRRLTDEACGALAHAHQLETLNLGGCAGVSERGVEAMAVQCTGLANLNLTGCTQISRRFLMHLIADLEFSEPATEWYGYKPKPDVDALRKAKRRYQLESRNAVVIQRHLRGALGRRRARDVYRQHLMRKVLVGVQARIRGVLQRRRWRWDGQARRQDRAATRLAAWWRGCVDRERVARIYDDMDRQAECAAAAVHVQRAWRGLIDRRFVALVRAEVRAQRLEEAKHQARLELAALLVQGIWRKRVARRHVEALRRDRTLREARARREDAAVRVIQRIYRGHLGRLAFAEVRRAFEHDLRCWHEAVKIQAGFRGMRGRRRAAHLRLLRRQELEMAMATRIQNAWRRHRARYMTAMARSLRDLRAMEAAAATEIQRMWRGRLGWFRAQRRRSLLEELRTREKAALDICRLYRGHKGREAFEVAYQLREVEQLARPLYAREAELVAEKARLAEDAQRLKNGLEAARKDTDELREELEAMLTVTHKFWDTARITGTPQRFLTEYLKVRMAEQLAEKEATIARDKDRYNELVVQARQRERMLRQVRRELEPLTRGMAVKTKRDRIVRLRNRVRLEKWAATTIQRHFRGHRLRRALFSWYRDYWTEVLDDTTGDTYFYNTWSEEVRWTRPLEMTLLPHKAVPPPDHWREDFDEERGAPVYVNETTGETTFDRPPELDYME